MKIFKYWKVIFVAIIILYGSITSGDNLSKVNFVNIKHLDKVIHLLFYFTLSVTLLSALHKNSEIKHNEAIIITTIFSISYGLIMEVLQYYAAIHRSADIYDAIANTIGCLIGVFLFRKINKLKIARLL